MTTPHVQSNVQRAVPFFWVRSIEESVRFYVDRLGFTLAFGDPSIPVNYVGLRRDTVEFHMQFQYEHEMGTTRVRFVVDDPDAVRADLGPALAPA